MLSKNIRVYVEILPSFAVEGGNDVLQHPVLNTHTRTHILNTHAHTHILNTYTHTHAFV